MTMTSAGGTGTTVAVRTWAWKSYTGFSIARPSVSSVSCRTRRSQSNAFGWSQFTVLRCSNGRCAWSM